MQIALLTLFNGLSTSYSLVNVVAEHLQMLLDHDIKVKLLVTEQCSLDNLQGVYADPRITWCSVTNSLNGKCIKWYDYSAPTDTLHESFAEELSVIIPSLISYLEDVDVCMLHDILYQGWHYIHNIAIRQVQKKLPHLKFISFTHSFPLTRPQSPPLHLLGFYTPMPNTTYVYPTYSGIPALSKQYQVPEGKCRVVYNSLSLLSFLAPEVQSLHQSVNLYDTDFLIVYPARLTPSKQCEKVAALAGSIYKNCDRSVKVIFCDFPSTDIDSTTYKQLIRDASTPYHLPAENIIFTSEYGFPTGFPRRAVLDLLSLSNLFICPSFSESFGLTVLEAASRGNFLVLNQCVPALEELGEQLHAYFMEWPAKTFDGIITPTYSSSEIEYYNKHAKKILYLML